MRHCKEGADGTYMIFNVVRPIVAAYRDQLFFASKWRVQDRLQRIVEYTIDLCFRSFEIVKDRWVGEDCYYRSDQQLVLWDEGFEGTDCVYLWVVEGQRDFLECLSILDDDTLIKYNPDGLGSSPQSRWNRHPFHPLSLPETQSDLDGTEETWTG